MTARELREKYLEFFRSKGHTVYPSAPLVPIDVAGREDTSLLFTGAGMVQFKPYFRGVAEPPSKRLTNVQKCMRTTDIESVGDLTHLTFFEMLGNFSFGDYFKKEAIAFSWAFMTSPDWLSLDPKRLSFTVHDGDEESFSYWSETLVAAGLQPASRIFRLSEETNFWPAGSFTKGPPGPCGPNTEMFYWVPDDEPPPESTSPLAGEPPPGSTSPLAGEVGACPGSIGERSEPGGGVSHAPYTKEDWLRDEAAGKWLEIWNDVFIQYEWKGHLADPSRPDKEWVKESLDPLPFQSVDTGMGLERTITVLTGMQSVYSNDLFEPVFRTLGEIVMQSGHAPALLNGDPSTPNIDRLVSLWSSKTQHEAPHCVAARIVADHVRAACFCIADGILPSNTGRGYVLRRLIRRAVLKGQRVLGIGEPFLHEVFPGVLEALGAAFPELRERKETIVETLRNEEEQFRRTLREGIDQFLRVLYDFALSQVDWSDWTADEVFRYATPFQDPSAFRATFPRSGLVISGERAFQLYDTYGFPLEVTQELCQEAGIEVDVEGYTRALEEAQERSRAAHSGETVYGGVEVVLDLSILFDRLDEEARTRPTPTLFTGYQETTTHARIVGALPFEGSTGIVLALDKSPFYVESGGEVSDTGWIRGTGFAFEVVDLIRQDGVIVHLARPIEGDFDLSGKSPEEARGYLQGRLFNQPVAAEVDAARRRRITRNHTATHLLHAALRLVLGKHVTQAGSLVAPDHLRFDFTHGKAMTDEEVAEVERIVNEKALEAIPIAIHENVPISEAKKRGAMALFGEKYGDTVRMVEAPGFSLELCGGCHVKNTAEIGLFKILHEGSAASGVRRIEAVTGEGAYAWAHEQEERLKQAASLLKTNPGELINALEKLQEQLREERKRLERMRSQAVGEIEVQGQPVGPVELVQQKLTEGDVQDATLVADRLAEGQPNRVVLVALVADGKVSLVAKAGAEAQKKGAHAGNLVRDLAKLVGGGGGGRPDFATAGGNEPGKVDEALKALADLLRVQLK